MNIEHLQHDVQRLAYDLSEATADVALLTRLKGAVELSGRLTIEHAAAQERLAAGMADMAIAERKARYAKYRDVTIITNQVKLTYGKVLAATFVITYEVLAYDHNTRTTDFVTKTADSFGQLPPEVYEYIMAEKAHELPAIILDLVPGDPMQAMDTYQLGLRRGFLTQ